MKRNRAMTDRELSKRENALWATYMSKVAEAYNDYHKRVSALYLEYDKENGGSDEVCKP